MGATSNNILGVSEVNLPAKDVIYPNYDVMPQSDLYIRVLDTISVTGLAQVFLTNDGTALGNPLFSSINSVTVNIKGDPGVLLGVSCEIISATEINVYIYDSVGQYGASIDVSLVVIGRTV